MDETDPDARELAMFFNRILLSKCEQLWAYIGRVSAGIRAEIDWAHQMDIDNDHTKESSNWVTPEKLAEFMAGVVFMTATSRNHQKAKGVLSVRPRFHVYFPITEVTDADTYAGLKRRLAARFGFCDQQALDAGRFIYGTTNPETTIHNGDRLLDARLDDFTDVGQTSMLTAEYSSRLAFTEATDWLVYEGGVWSDSAPAAQGIAQ